MKDLSAMNTQQEQ